MFKHDELGKVSFGKFEYLIQVIIVINLISFSFETLPDLSEQWQYRLHIIEVSSVVIFTLEYFIRILFCKPRLSYVFSFFGIVDLLAILPFYLASGIDLRSSRSFRLLRLFRMLKLVKYNNAMRRYKFALKVAREEIIIFGCASLILLYLSAVGMYYFENEAQPEHFSSIISSLWWAVITLTTVGYGDVYPITVGGRIFTFFILMIGLGVVAVPAGLFASALCKAREEDPSDGEVDQNPTSS